MARSGLTRVASRPRGGVDQAGYDDVDADPAGCRFAAGRRAQPVERGLGCDVGGGVGRGWEACRGRGDEDDRAAVGHDRQGVLAAQEVGAHVDGHDAVPLPGGCSGKVIARSALACSPGKAGSILLESHTRRHSLIMGRKRNFRLRRRPPLRRPHRVDARTRRTGYLRLRVLLIPASSPPAACAILGA